MLGVPDRLSAGRAGEDGSIVWRRSWRILGLYRLKSEPFLDAGAAERVQTVKEGEGLIEQLSANLEQSEQESK